MFCLKGMFKKKGKGLRRGQEFFELQKKGQ